MSELKNGDLTAEEKAHVVRTIEKLAADLIVARTLAELTNEPISTFAPSPRTPADVLDELKQFDGEGRLMELNVTEGPRFTTVMFTYRTSYIRKENGA